MKRIGRRRRPGYWDGLSCVTPPIILCVNELWHIICVDRAAAAVFCRQLARQTFHDEEYIRFVVDLFSERFWGDIGELRPRELTRREQQEQLDFFTNK